VDENGSGNVEGRIFDLFCHMDAGIRANESGNIFEKPDVVGKLKALDWTSLLRSAPSGIRTLLSLLEARIRNGINTEPNGKVNCMSASPSQVALTLRAWK
jgi:hypothetical protein